MRRMRYGIRLAGAALALAALCGCAPLLERRYATAEPHSSRYWESEAAGTLRAENSQDIVNDLLLLVDRHAESATLRLYHFDDDLTVADTLEQAAMELQNETPLGSYAVSYVTSSTQARQRGYYEVRIQIGYRRTAEELQAIVNATSPEAVYPLLRQALDEGQSALAVRVGYWGTDGMPQIEEACARLREEEAQGGDWPAVAFFPEHGPVGLVEFRLDAPPEPEPPEVPPEDPPETPEMPEVLD